MRVKGEILAKVPERKVNGVRILTEERICNLSEGSLKCYRKVIKRERAYVHNVHIDWCCTPKGPSCVVVRQRELTESEIEDIRTFDYVWSAIQREMSRRKPSLGA